MIVTSANSNTDEVSRIFSSLTNNNNLLTLASIRSTSEMHSLEDRLQTILIYSCHILLSPSKKSTRLSSSAGNFHVLYTKLSLGLQPRCLPVAWLFYYLFLFSLGWIKFLLMEVLLSTLDWIDESNSKYKEDCWRLQEAGYLMWKRDMHSRDVV